MGITLEQLKERLGIIKDLQVKKIIDLFTADIRIPAQSGIGLTGGWFAQIGGTTPPNSIGSYSGDNLKMQYSNITIPHPSKYIEVLIWHDGAGGATITAEVNGLKGSVVDISITPSGKNTSSLFLQYITNKATSFNVLLIKSGGFIRFYEIIVRYFTKAKEDMI